MKNRLDLKNCLRVFSEVISKGDREDGNYYYKGFTASSDFDGYTCYLSFCKVTLTMMFHGKYEIDYPNKAELTQFENKLAGFKLTKC